MFKDTQNVLDIRISITNGPKLIVSCPIFSAQQTHTSTQTPPPCEPITLTRPLLQNTLRYSMHTYHQHKTQYIDNSRTKKSTLLPLLPSLHMSTMHTFAVNPRTKQEQKLTLPCVASLHIMHKRSTQTVCTTTICKLCHVQKI